MGELYQQYKVTYLRGIQLFNEGRLDEARSHLSDAVEMLYDLFSQDDATKDEKFMYSYMLKNLKAFIASRIDSQNCVADEDDSEAEYCA